MTLWHFTCAHGRGALGESGVLLPGRVHSPEQPWAELGPLSWMADVVWLTDQPDGIGTMLEVRTMTKCDRLAHRYRVTDETSVQRWVRWAHDVRIDATTRWGLEHADLSAIPTSWWLSQQPVPVVLDEQQ